MADNAFMSALGALLTSAGTSAGTIADEHDQRMKEEADRRQRDIDRAKARWDKYKQDAAKDTGGEKLRTAMQELQNPTMAPQDATAVLQNSTPEQIAEAHGLVTQVAGAAPNGGLPVMQPEDTPDQVKAKFMAAVDQQESGNNANQKEHPRAANGYQAYGKHGIVPELHVDRIGLDPSNPDDIAKWKADPKLQDATFEKIVDSIGKANNWDPARMRVAYYGHTKNPDAPQHLADGRTMPSSNQDTSKFMDVYNGVSGKESNAARSDRIASGNTGEGFQSTARQAMNKIINSDITPAKKKTAANDALKKAYSTMTADEIEQNKGALQGLASLAQGEDADNALNERVTEASLTRKATVMMHAAELDQGWQVANEKIKNGKSRLLTDEDRRSVEASLKSLQVERKSLEDAAAQLSKAKANGQQSELAARPDLSSSKDTPGWFGTGFGSQKVYSVDSKKIADKMDELDRRIKIRQDALDGFGNVPTQTEAPAAATIDPKNPKYFTPD